MEWGNQYWSSEERYLVSLDCQNIPASIAHGWVGYKFSCYTIDWERKDPVELSVVFTALNQDKGLSCDFGACTPVRVVGNLNVTEETIPSILDLCRQSEECKDSIWLVVCADSSSTLEDIYRTCFLFYTGTLHIASFDAMDIREAMGAALSSKIQVLTSRPYLSSENDLSLPEDGRFVLCNAHTGDIPESWGLEDQEKLVDTQYSKLAVEPAFFLNMTLFYCPFEYHRIIYTKEILGDGRGLPNQEDEDPSSIADDPSAFDDIFHGRFWIEKQD